MAYGPHTAGERERMLEALGIALRRRPLRGDPGDRPGDRARPPPGPHRDGAHGAPGGARRAQPDRPRELPRRRRLPPPPAAGRRPDPAARRVLHRLHAVPAGDQPGDPPDDLRVPVAPRRADGDGRRLGVALRRCGGDGGSRPDDLPGDRPGATSSSRAASTRTTARRSRPTSPGRTSPSPRSPCSPADPGPGRPTSLPSSGCWPIRATRSPASSPAQPYVLGLLEPMEEIGRLAHAAGALFVAVVEPVEPCRPRAAGGVRRRHRGRRGPVRSGCRPSTAAPTSASWPVARPSSGRSRVASSG